MDGGFVAGGDDQKDRVAKTLLPITIKQALDAEMDSAGNFSIDGVALSQVEIVGQIMQANQRQTNVSLEIEDGTGRIDVRRFFDQEDTEGSPEKMEAAGWTEGVYVRVAGNLRTMNERKNMVAFTVKPVTDFNQVTYHFLSCIHSHLYHLKASKPGIATTGSSGGMMGGPQFNSNPYGGGYEAPAALNDQFTPLQAAVLAAVKKLGHQAQGGSIEDITAAVGNAYSASDIGEAIRVLNDLGQLYSTIDEQHFRAD